MFVNPAKGTSKSQHNIYTWWFEPNSAYNTSFLCTSMQLRKSTIWLL